MIRKHSSGLIVQLLLGAAVMIAALSLAACYPVTVVPGTVTPGAVPATAVPPTEAKAESSPTDQNDTCIAPSPPTSFFYFPEVEGVVTRKTIIAAPKQNGNPVNITPLELPGEEDNPETIKSDAEHPNGSAFRFWVILPKVCDTVTNDVLTEFEDPLTITVILKEGDAPEGELSLFVAAKKENEWNSRILKTTLIKEGDTLIATATITTTAPSDPVGGGFP